MGIEKLTQPEVTTTYHLPGKLATPEEKETIWQALHDKQSEITNAAFMIKPQMERAKYIVVRGINLNGYFGDNVRNSYLLAALQATYGDKVLYEALSEYPDVLGDTKRKNVRYDRGETTSYVSYEESGRLVEEQVPNEDIVRIIADTLMINVDITVDGELYKLLSIFGNFADIHGIHFAQVVWEKAFGAQMTDPPKSALLIPENTRRDNETLYETITKNDEPNTRYVVINPDAYPLHFAQKEWDTKRWVAMIEKVLLENPSARIVLTTGVEHPELTKKIQAKLKRKLDATTFEERLVTVEATTLPEYISFLNSFPKDRTVVVGLESAIAEHVAPALDMRSVVIAGGELRFPPKMYGPWGGIIICTDSERAFSVPEDTVAASVTELLAA